MKKRSEKGILLLLLLSFLASVFMAFILKDVLGKISKEYIEFIIGLSITMAGFGLVAFQVAKASDELKKDFIESSIFMVISAILGIVYWAEGITKIFAVFSSFFFLWGLILLLIILIDKRFDIIR
jgi:hypothetical protein